MDIKQRKSLDKREPYIIKEPVLLSRLTRILKGKFHKSEVKQINVFRIFAIANRMK